MKFYFPENICCTLIILPFVPLCLVLERFSEYLENKKYRTKKRFVQENERAEKFIEVIELRKKWNLKILPKDLILKILNEYTIIDIYDDYKQNLNFIPGNFMKKTKKDKKNFIHSFYGTIKEGDQRYFMLIFKHVAIYINKGKVSYDLLEQLPLKLVSFFTAEYLEKDYIKYIKMWFDDIKNIEGEYYRIL